MDYVEMIKDPELVLGFQELVSDSDGVVVKRTVKVFTSVYHHTLRLLSSGELDEEIVLKSWPSINGVVDSLMSLVKPCENEGILIHLLRFIEAAIMSHLMYDLTRFPAVFERGRHVIKKGLKSLKDLVTTPYVGGSSFIVGVRALISIACLRPDLWEPVTDLLKKQLLSLPPTLFDHNVRSLHKTLQRNLFRLLRRAETPELKEKLIEMMVRVGVPRKIIMPWAPSAAEVRKRSHPGSLNGDLLLVRSITPPEKKLCVEASDQHIIVAPSFSRPDTPEIPLDPRLAPAQPQNTPKTNPLEDVCPSDSSTTAPKASNADLLFLTSLIPTAKSAPTNPPTTAVTSDSLLAKEIFDKLDLDRVCSLVIQNMGQLPDEEPMDLNDLLGALGKVSSDSSVMKTRLSSLLGGYLERHNVTSLSLEDDEQNETLKTNAQRLDSEIVNEYPADVNDDKMDTMTSASKTSSTSSTPSSTPPPPPPPPLADTDLRQVYSRPLSSVGDVDMRIVDPRLASRDPRLLKDPRLKKDFADSSRLSHPPVPCEPRVDPRLDNRSAESKSDPRLSQADEARKNSAPRKSRWDPRTPHSTTSAPSPSQTTESQQGSFLDRPPPPPETTRSHDPRVNRTGTQGQGLLPHPDPRTFSQNVDPRLQLQHQGMGCDPRMQQQQQTFASQPPFTFPPVNMNVLGQFNNHFLGNLPMPPHAMPPHHPMLNGPPFGWHNNLQTPPPPPHMLVPQSLTSVPPGLLLQQ